MLYFRVDYDKDLHFLCCEVVWQKCSVHLSAVWCPIAQFPNLQKKNENTHKRTSISNPPPTLLSTSTPKPASFLFVVCFIYFINRHHIKHCFSATLHPPLGYKLKPCWDIQYNMEHETATSRLTTFVR